MKEDDVFWAAVFVVVAFVFADFLAGGFFVAAFLAVFGTEDFLAAAFTDASEAVFLAETESFFPVAHVPAGAVKMANRRSMKDCVSE